MDPNDKYLILISDHQRRILLGALTNPLFEPADEDAEEADDLLGCLKGDGGLTPDRDDKDDVVNDFTA